MKILLYVIFIYTTIITVMCNECTCRLKYEKMSDSIKINGYGSAVSISNFILLTTAHNVDTTANIYVELKNEWIKVNVVKTDVEKDLALLKSSSKFDNICLSDKELKIGSQCKIVGSPKSLPIISLTGLLDNKYYKGLALHKIITEEPEFQVGFSGGAVIYNKKLVGLVSAGQLIDGTVSKNIVYYVPSSVIKAFIESVKIDF